MKKFFFLPIIVILFWGIWGCDNGSTSASKETANSSLKKVATGLPPIAYLVKAIAQDKIEVYSVLPPGRSPHDYTPGPHDIKRMASAEVFFTTAMPFELRAVKPLTKTTKVVDITTAITRIPLSERCEHDHSKEACGHQHHDDHSAPHEMLDPHVWLSFDNAVLMSKVIAAELSKIDKDNAQFYQKNLEDLLKRLNDLKSYADVKLKPFAGRTFYVYHPAFGYFAHANKLKQSAVELGGREPSASHLAKLITVMRKEQVKVIFVQVQFNPNATRALARETKAKVVELDPLAYDLEKSFKTMTDALVEGFSFNSKDR